MTGPLELVVSYGAVRVVLIVALAVPAAVLWVPALARKGRAARVLAAALAFAFLAALVLVPVENVFLRFDTPESAAAYSMPNETVLETVERGQWAALICKSRKALFVERDAAGWLAIPPLSAAWTHWGTAGNMNWQARALPGGVHFVCADYRIFADPAKNGWIAESITDTGASPFVCFRQEILGKDGSPYATDEYYYAFADAGAPGYRLVLNGETVPLE